MYKINYVSDRFLKSYAGFKNHAIWSCIVVHGLSDYSVRSVYLECIYPLYYMASLLTFINPLLLNGDSLGTSVIFGTHLNRIADSNINLS